VGDFHPLLYAGLSRRFHYVPASLYRGFFLRSEGDGGIGWAMIEMLRIYSKGFLGNVTIEELVP
jgi:hypothetical protein